MDILFISCIAGAAQALGSTHAGPQARRDGQGGLAPHLPGTAADIAGYFYLPLVAKIIFVTKMSATSKKVMNFLSAKYDGV